MQQCPEMMSQAASLSLDSLTPAPDVNRKMKYLCCGNDFVLPLLINATRPETPRKYLLITEESDCTPIDIAIDLFGDNQLSASKLHGSDEQSRNRMSALANKRCLDTVIYRASERTRVHAVCQPLLDKAHYAITDDDTAPWKGATLELHSLIITEMPALPEYRPRSPPLDWKTVPMYDRLPWLANRSWSIYVPAFTHHDDTNDSVETIVKIPVSKQLFVWKNPTAVPCKEDS